MMSSKVVARGLLQIGSIEHFFQLHRACSVYSVPSVVQKIHSVEVPSSTPFVKIRDGMKLFATGTGLFWQTMLVFSRNLNVLSGIARGAGGLLDSRKALG